MLKILKDLKFQMAIHFNEIHQIINLFLPDYFIHFNLNHFNSTNLEMHKLFKNPIE